MRGNQDIHISECGDSGKYSSESKIEDWLVSNKKYSIVCISCGDYVSNSDISVQDVNENDIFTTGNDD